MFQYLLMNKLIQLRRGEKMDLKRKWPRQNSLSAVPRVIVHKLPLPNLCPGSKKNKGPKPIKCSLSSMSSCLQTGWTSHWQLLYEAWEKKKKYVEVFLLGILDFCRDKGVNITVTTLHSWGGFRNQLMVMLRLARKLVEQYSIVGTKMHQYSPCAELCSALGLCYRHIYQE